MRPSSAEKKAQENREVQLLASMASGSKEDLADMKITMLSRMITKLQDEILPQKIERVLETVDGKLDVFQAKQKKTTFVIYLLFLVLFVTFIYLRLYMIL